MDTLTAKTPSNNMSSVLIEKFGPLMDIDDLAVLLKIKRQSMYQNLYHGRIEIRHAKLGKKYLFQTEDVAEFLETKLSA